MNRSPEIDDLAIKIADQSALSFIDCNSLPVPAAEHGCGEQEEFFDIGDEEEHEALAEEIRYLELRGLLERHPANPNWVQLFQEVADEAVPVF